MKKILALLLLLGTPALGASSRGQVACYMYAADGTPLTQTGGALNTSGGGAGGGGDASAANQTTEIARLTSILASAGSAVAQEHATAASPNSCRMSDGAAFYDARQVRALTASDVVTFANTSINVGNFPANQTVSWSGQSVSISGTPAVTISSGTVTGNDGGTKITAATMPAGGVGLTGWLSGILQQLVNGINVTVQNATLAVTESGNFIVQPGNTANTTPWLEKLHDGTNPLLFTTKAVQATNVLPTQDFKDSGRSARTFTLDGFAIAATTETLHTMSYSTDNAALTTGTSYSVTAGKRLRLQQLVGTLHTITGNTTAITCIIRIRANAAGAAIVSSPVQYVMALPGIAAANQSAGSVPTQFPDGWEFAASTGIGVTSTCPGFVATTAAPKLNITITGYEY